MRIRALATALAFGVVAVAVSAGPASAAYQPYTPTITCDDTAGTISTAVTGGNFGANQPVTVRFQVRYGSSIAAGGSTARLIPQYGTTTTVPTRTLADGSVAVAGYTRPWPAAGYAFYTETVRVSVLGASGYEQASNEATCTRDTRTEITLTCDPAARSITAAATTTRYAPGSRTRLEYRVLKTSWQTAPGEPRWTGGPLGYPATPTAAHTVTADATGAWSDVGYVHLRPTQYFTQEWVEVKAFDQAGIVVGRADLTCSYTAL